jgi:hypothetical protein
MVEPTPINGVDELKRYSTNEHKEEFENEKLEHENNVQLQRTVSSVQPNYPSPAKLTVIMLSLYVSVFLIALDRTIIGVAIPRITDEFNSLSDVGM